MYVTEGALKRLAHLMAGQDVNAVAITGGTISGVTLNGAIGGTTPAAGAFTTITASSTIVGSGSITATKFIEVVTAGSSAANLSNGGLTTFGSETTLANTYTLDAPVAGVRKSLICNSVSTLARTVYTGSSLVRIGATTATSSITKLVFDLADEAIIMEGISSVAWGVLCNTGSVALTS